MTLVDDRPPPSEDEVTEEEGEEEGTLDKEETVEEVKVVSVATASSTSSTAVQKVVSDKGATLQVASSASSSSTSSSPNVDPSESIVQEPKLSVAIVKHKTGRGRTTKQQQHQPKRRQLSDEFFQDQDQEKNPPLPMSGALKVPKQFEKYTTKIKLHSTARAAKAAAAAAAAAKAGKATATPHQAKIKSVRGGGNRGAAAAATGDTKEDSHKSKKGSKKNSKKSKKSKQATEKSNSLKHGKVVKSKQTGGGGGGAQALGGTRTEAKSVRKPKPQPETQPLEPPKQYIFESNLQSHKAANTTPKPVNTRSALPEPKVRPKAYQSTFYKGTKGKFKGGNAVSRNVCKVLTEVVKEPKAKTVAPRPPVSTVPVPQVSPKAHAQTGPSCTLNTVTETTNIISSKRVEAPPPAVFTNDEMEDLNDELTDLNTSISTLRHSYGSIIRSLANMQSRRAAKKALAPVTANPNDSNVKAPDGGTGGTAPTIDDICGRVSVDYAAKYSLDRFLNADSRDAVFVELFREVNQINAAMAHFKTFFDAQGYFQQAAYTAQDELLLTREQYTACLKVIKDLAKAVVTILKAYNTDLLDMFRITSQAN